MTSKARKRLEEYDIEGAAAFDLSVVLYGYLRQTPDDESEQQRVVEGALNRWRTALLTKAAPELEAKNKRAVARCRELAEELTKFAEDLDGKT